ncbi:AraC family transcriptional regulator [Bisbaumannia pacifica]|uniref:Transcriptional regulator n=1 Tax=Bisbaumannia pacifica TaxID=77098 RepID=A0A510XB29_9GAMM|nr:AraC family transcriptional regulator [Halomonas pacifica]MBH8579333.1 AraC family transcriptional regulator [Halomonas pacifica]GEK45790.1 transcriptional regulator [Halomonas pacifica]
MTVPLTRQQIAAEFRHPDSACRWMCQINGPHRLEVPQPRQLSFRHQGTRLGHVSIGTIEYATRVTVGIADLTHSYSISLPLQGTQSIEYQGAAFDSDAAVGAIISPSQPLRLSMDEQCQKRLVRLSRQALEHKLSQLLRRQLSQPVIFDPRMPLSGTVKEWWQMVANLQEMLHAEGSLCDIPEVWSNFENSLITSLLYTQPHNYTSELLGRQQGRPAYLGELEALLHESLDRPLGLADLERAAGVSRERLYRDFHTHYGVSPIAYFRQLRFDYVRQRLERSAPNESVSSIAMDCGFQQLGRFSKEYKARYGELPSETLKRSAAAPLQ